MVSAVKPTEFEVIAVSSGNVSYSTSSDGHADITISVPDLSGAQEELYYVLKLPAYIDEVAFQVALEAAFHAVAGLEKLTGKKRDEIPPAAKIKSTGRSKPASSSNTARLEKLKQTILDDAEWLPAQEVSRRSGSAVDIKNPSGLPNRWTRADKIFAITSEGKDLYPAYALYVGGQPLPQMKKIIQLFGETKTPWSLALWFGSPNSWLGNQKPKDLLASAPERVLEAVARAKEGPVHG
ncbi:hypothetical protein C1Y43_09590 [Pantoea sp. ICBG 828]|uniref:hypothetical protein n=1 Tax=unclassified Pantoea TaxID=2630326 RepID=UPI000CE2E62B|nr:MULTISPECIES: hypothetical protein [unclassified Pantoea]NIG34446.1 DUF2384 domain-containing protein [Pantoea sp. Ap-959]PPC68359.1 hypothetical protein C1Y43_09590 [Pantoea sp. ICBG 828]